jgi:hypothetical protein
VLGVYSRCGLHTRAVNVAFDDAREEALSPIRHLDRMRAPLIVAYSNCETPEFQRQNREFAAAIEAAGKKVRLLMDEYYNHFELPETLGGPYGLLILPSSGRPDHGRVVTGDRRRNDQSGGRRTRATYAKASASGSQDEGAPVKPGEIAAPPPVIDLMVAL